MQVLNGRQAVKRQAVESMQDAAVRVRHHPELAQALRKLAEKYGMR